MDRQRGGGLVTLQARTVSPRLTRSRSGHTLAGMYADAPGSDVSTSVHLVVSGRTLCGVRLRQPTDPSTDREGRPIRRPMISYTYPDLSPEIASCAVCRARAGLGPWGGDFVPKRYLTATAIAAALALTACSDHDEGADLPDRLEFTATGTSAEGPGAEVICGGVGMPWALTISNIVEEPIAVSSIRDLGDHACERDGLAISCSGVSNNGGPPAVITMTIDLSADGRSGVGRYAYEGSASVRCSVEFALAERVR